MRAGQVPTDESLRRLVAEAAVPDEHLEPVVIALHAALDDIHEGVLRRYGLRPSEMHAWHALVGPPRGGRP